MYGKEQTVPSRFSMNSECTHKVTRIKYRCINLVNTHLKKTMNDSFSMIELEKVALSDLKGLMSLHWILCFNDLLLLGIDFNR